MTKAFDLIGVDGTSSGWVASIGSSKRRCLSSINFFENLDELLTNYPDSVVVIDMPIELNEKNYLRECDILAKRYLGKNFQSSIFIFLMLAKGIGATISTDTCKRNNKEIM